MLQDRIEKPEIQPLTSRFQKRERPYIYHIRERIDEDGNVKIVHKKKVYDDLRI
jgi:hypothetical protein